MEPRTRIGAGIGLLLVGAILVAVEMLGIVPVAVVVALPLAVLLLASGTILLGISAVESGRRPV